MVASRMTSVADARARAESAFNRGRREWAAYDTGSAATLSIPLSPPTEREALRDQLSAQRWVDSWRAIDVQYVEWTTRHWSSAGAQNVPVRCTLTGADDIAEFSGIVTSRRWKQLRDRAARLRQLFGDRDPLRAAIMKHGTAIERLEAEDFALLTQVLEWLRTHPTSGFRVRQIPIPGMHTKWLGSKRAVVEALHSAVTGDDGLGLLEAPDRVRVRFLDPDQRPGGLIDVTAPIDELVGLDISPSTVFVFENLESVLAMPPWPGAVAIHGGGYALALRALPWVRDIRMVYWGDLDADGFAILNRLRANGFDAQSALMDAATLREFSNLCVPDPGAGSVRELSHLTEIEREALALVAELGGVRLEQERLPWPFVLDKLRAAEVGSSN